MKTLALFFTTMSLLMMQNCNTTSPQAKNNPRLSSNYEVVEFLGNEQIPEGITIAFDTTAQRISGMSGCNNYFGKFEQNGNKLTISNMASTKKLCIDQEGMNLESTKESSIMALETKIQQELGNVHSFMFEGERLVLKNEENKVLFIAKPNKFDSQTDFTLLYHTHSMLGEKHLTYKNNELICTQNELKNSITLSAEDLQELKNAFNELNLEHIPNEEAPTNERHVDGAAYATFSVIYNGKTYKTPSFDHGRPPYALERIVKMMTKHQLCE